MSVPSSSLWTNYGRATDQVERSSALMMAGEEQHVLSFWPAVSANDKASDRIVGERNWIIDSGCTGVFPASTAGFLNPVAFDERNGMLIHCANGGKMRTNGGADFITKFGSLQVQQSAQMPAGLNLLGVPAICDRDDMDVAVVLTKHGGGIVSYDSVLAAALQHESCIPIERDGRLYKINHQQLLPEDAASLAAVSPSEPSDPFAVFEACYVSEDPLFDGSPVLSPLMRAHIMLGHLGFDSLISLIRNKCVTGMISVPEDELNGPHPFCDVCKAAAMLQKSRPSTRHTVSDRGELVYADVLHVGIPSLSGATMVLHLRDAATKFTWVYFLQRKSDVFDKFVEFCQQVLKPQRVVLRHIRTDNGGEFIDGRFAEFCLMNGIKHEFTVPRVHENAGDIESSNRFLMQTTRCLLMSANLRLHYWAEAMNCAVMLRNMTSSRGAPTPWERWYGVKPDVSHLHRFGAFGWARLSPEVIPHKLAPVSLPVRFLGYSHLRRAYRLLNMRTGAIIERDDVALDDFPTISRSERGGDMLSQSFRREMLVHTGNGSDGENFPIIVDSMVPETNLNVETSDLVNGQSVCEPFVQQISGSGDERRYPCRERHVPAKFNDYDLTGNFAAATSFHELENMLFLARMTFDTGWIMRSNEDMKHLIGAYNGGFDAPDARVPLLALSVVDEFKIPVSVDEAIRSPQATEWLAAIEAENQSLIEAQVYDWVELPSDKKAIGSRYIFNIKRGKDGDVERFKARLVGQGFSQVPGVDFDETWAPTVRHSSFRLILAITASLDLNMEKFDFPVAFLNADNDKKIYMKPPKGLDAPRAGLVMLLKKALYGLKQASRLWNRTLNFDLVNRLGFTRLKSDPCVYMRSKGGNVMFLLLHVDDVLLSYSSRAERDVIVQYLTAKYKIKCLGAADFILGIEIERDRVNRTIKLTQRRYTEDILQRFNMTGASSSAVPADPDVRLSGDMSPKTDVERELMAVVPYRAAIGSLIYLAVCTRPDISVAVSDAARFCQNPGVQHWQAVKKILCYLNNSSLDGGIILGGKIDGESNDLIGELVGYSDADHARDLDKRRSTTGYVFLLNGKPISWRSRLQKTTAKSTAEAEYMALDETSAEALWLRGFIIELGFAATLGPDCAVTLYEDNAACIVMAVDPVISEATKHIAVRYFALRDRIEEGLVKVVHCPTSLMVADILTKPLRRSVFELLRVKLWGHGAVS